MTEEAKRVLTPKSWAALVILSVVMSFIGVLTAPYGPSWMFSMVLGSFTAPIVALFFVMLISKVSSSFQKMLTPQILALVYTVTTMSIVFCYSMIPYGIVHNALNGRINTASWHPATWLVANETVFGPTNLAVIPSMLTGGVATPWADWSPFLGWWLAYSICWLVFWVAWMALFSERWIEVEKLPYPAAMTGTMPITMMTQKEKVGEGPSSRMFLVGVILGLLFILPEMAHAVNSAIPDFYGWTSSPYEPWFFGVFTISRTSASAAIPIMEFICVNPMIYALFYLFPQKILFSIWIFSVVGMLIPSEIAYLNGYYSELPTTAERFHAVMSDPPFMWNAVWMGAVIGVFITWFVLNVPYVTSLFKKQAEPQKKALPPMISWALIAVTTILLLGLLIQAGADPLGSVAIVLSMWILHISMMRVFGFAGITGTAWGYPNDWTNLPYLTKYVYTPPGYSGSALWYTRSASMTTTMWLTNRWTGELFLENNTAFGMLFAIPLSYKVAYDTGTHPRDVTKVVLVSGILSALIGFPVAIWFSYTVGTNNWPMTQMDAWWHWVFDAPWGNINSGLGMVEPVWPYFLGGIVIVLVLGFLNFRFIWWPLDPVGVAMGLGAAGTGWILPAVVAWIAKTLVLRTGGTKLNDRTVMPLVIGFLVGYWVMIFFGAVGGLIAFFVK
jgi:hypothetical protein